ncbi:MAG: hypothetical protein ACE366_18670 [Bradymonadia bacterium]
MYEIRWPLIRCSMCALLCVACEDNVGRRAVSPIDMSTGGIPTEMDAQTPGQGGGDADGGVVVDADTPSADARSADAELPDLMADSDVATDATLSADMDLPDADAPDADSPDAEQPDAEVPDAEPLVECGDGVVEGDEMCDDGVTADCLGTHDGGDGRCVPQGTCVEDFILTDVGVCVPSVAEGQVDIFVDNFCNMRVVPESFDVPRGQRLSLTYNNHSVDYPVDVWLSYGGGFLDLPTGDAWDDRFEHCGTPRPYQAAADISTACSSFRLIINCNGR